MAKRAPTVKKGERVPSSDIQEVSDFLDAKAELDRFVAQNELVFREYRDLVEVYNTKKRAAETVVKHRGVSCGPFENYSVSVAYNWEEAFDELGKDMFLECGGGIETKSVYVGNEEEMDRAILAGRVPEECVNKFRKVKRSYRKVKEHTAP